MSIVSIQANLCGAVAAPPKKHQKIFLETTTPNRNTGPDTVSISPEAMAMMHTQTGPTESAKLVEPQHSETKETARVPFIRLADYILESFKEGHSEVEERDDIPGSTVEWHDVPIEIAALNPAWEPFLNGKPAGEPTPSTRASKTPHANAINKNSFFSLLMESIFLAELEENRTNTPNPTSKTVSQENASHLHSPSTPPLKDNEKNKRS